jgi:hypothetical protein
LGFGKGTSSAGVRPPCILRLDFRWDFGAISIKSQQKYIPIPSKDGATRQ